MRKEDIEKLWNDQADEYNQWSELDSDEKVEWAIQCFEKDIVAEFERQAEIRNDRYMGFQLVMLGGQGVPFSTTTKIDSPKKYKIIIKEVE